MLEKVYSGLPFFYNWDENTPGIISCHVKLKEKIECRMLEEAVNEALEIHKHFKVRLVIHSNNVYYEYNDKLAKVYEGIEDDFSLIRDTQDYLFAFRVAGEMVYLDVFHLLSDGDGVIAFCKTVALLYFSKIHADKEDWDVLIEKRVKQYSGERQKIDPYTVDKVVHREAKREQEEIPQFLQLYEEGDEERFISMKWNYEAFCKNPQIGWVSPYVLVNVLLGNVINQQCQSEECIGAYMPINMRKRIGLRDSMYNCLSYTNVRHVKRRDGMSLEEQCREYTNSLKLHYGLDNSLYIMSEDAKFIDIMQNEKLSISRKCGIVRGITRRTKNMRGSFGMSYIQFCSEEEVYRRYIAELSVCPPNSKIGIVCEMFKMGNEINLCVRYGKKQEEMISMLIQEMQGLGMNVDVQEVRDINTKIAIDSIK